MSHDMPNYNGDLAIKSTAASAIWAVLRLAAWVDPSAGGLCPHQARWRQQRRFDAAGYIDWALPCVHPSAIGFNNRLGLRRESTIFSDDYESLRMDEKIAIGILEEQALCYPTDPFIISVPTFDGQVYRIGNL